MSRKRMRKLVGVVFLCAGLMSGCNSNSNDDTHTEVNSTDENVNANFEENNENETNNSAVESQEIHSETSVFKISDAFNLSEKRAWFQVYDYPTAYDSTVTDVFIVENGTVDVYTAKMKLEEFDGLGVAEIEEKLSSNLRAEKQKITYEYIRDDTGNNVRIQFIDFGDADDQRVNFLGNDPFTVLTETYIGMGDNDGGQYVITPYTFDSEIQFEFNGITDADMEEF